jgi:hypothetical protein
MSRFGKQAFEVSATISAMLILIGIALFLTETSATGFSFGGKEGTPYWGGEGRPQSIPWWGVFGLGMISFALSFFFRATSTVWDEEKFFLPGGRKNGSTKWKGKRKKR